MKKNHAPHILRRAEKVALGRSPTKLSCTVYVSLIVIREKNPTPPYPQKKIKKNKANLPKSTKVNSRDS